MPSFAAAQTQQVHTHFSTHDYNSRTPSAGQQNRLPATWVDVKTPGDGRTYSVGTVVVQTTDSQNGASFSDLTGMPVPQYPVPPNTPTGFTTPTLGATRQVIVMQCSGFDPAAPANDTPEQSILWQRYWYGDSLDPAIPPDAWVRRANNARAISVWPMVDDAGNFDAANTRIAIGGETFDMLMEGNQFDGAEGWDLIVSQVGNGNNGTNGLANGFVAVFDGNGVLQWSYQFYFEGEEGHAAITDLSIRVVETADGPRDVVTYCGMSSFGVPTDIVDADNTLSPILPFDSPGPNAAGQVTTSGAAVNNVPGQWDGIVGRLSNVHGDPDPTLTVREFHSIVGGFEQDALFGLAEIDENRFTVVGGSHSDASEFQPGDEIFPYTDDNPITDAVDWFADGFTVGVQLTFDASGIAIGDNLELEYSEALGSAGGNSHTIARDVIVDRAPSTPAGESRYIVGATTDPLMHDSVSRTPNAAFTPNEVNGFVYREIALTGAPPIPLDFTYLDNLGACGIAQHPEFRNHLNVLGGYGTLDVRTLVVDTFDATRADTVPATEDYPAHVGAVTATTTGRGLEFGYQSGTWNPLSITNQFYNGPQNGGGIAVDENGRVNIVGAALATGHSVVPPLVPGPSLARPWTSFGAVNTANGVRTVVDMLPLVAGGGVGRTDGSGTPTAIATAFPTPTVSGGTTPICSLSPFGPRIGEPEPALRRTTLDIIGDVAPGIAPTLFIDAAPSNAGGAIIMFAFGTPSPATTVVSPVFGGTTMTGIEQHFTAQSSTFVSASPGLPIRLALSPMQSGVSLQAQVLFTLTSSIPTGTGGTCDDIIDFAATPAIWLSL